MIKKIEVECNAGSEGRIKVVKRSSNRELMMSSILLYFNQFCFILFYFLFFTIFIKQFCKKYQKYITIIKYSKKIL